MYLKKCLYSTCSVLIFVNFYSSVLCEPKPLKDDPSKKVPKNSTKILTRSFGANKSNSGAVFTLRMGTNGESNQQCQCTPFYICDSRNVYQPKANEREITCQYQEACCILSENSANSTPLPEPIVDPTPSITKSGTEVCVAPSQCDQTALAAMYGHFTLMQKNTFSDCRNGELLCPADNVLTNTNSTNSTVTPPTEVTPIPDEDCTCAPAVYCRAVFGQNIIQNKIVICDLGEICCPRDSISPPEVNTTGSTPTVNPVPEKPTTECGIKKDVLEDKISGQSATTFGEFPWMALLLEKSGKEEKLVCGASIISTKLILTAAHCVYKKPMGSFIIRAGEFDLTKPSNSEEMPHQDRAVQNITIHLGYIDQILINDVALLLVDPPFEYSSNVAPICLPLINSPYSPSDLNLYDLDKCIATGWGVKSLNDKSLPSTLGKINLKYVPSNKCLTDLRKSTLGSRFVLHPSLICAIGAPGIDTCKGDGGGPLICPLKSTPNKYVQIAIIAGGLNCTLPYPGLYASLLQPNSQWITDEIYFKTIFEA